MAEAYPNENLSFMSSSLYRIVNDIIGPEYMVKLRQQGWKWKDTFESCKTWTTSTLNIISGSMAEGYHFQSSDVDYMEIENKIKVLTSNVCFVLNKTYIDTVLMMETENVPPGFALLRCIRYDQRNVKLYKSLVFKGSDVFVSSKIARESHWAGSWSFVNGPSQRRVLQYTEIDSVYTFKCPFWPKEAKSFIYRSIRHGWPSFNVLQDICQDGCLFVPINSKQQTFIECSDLEWRISFSMAEKKLIHSMNHSQFLCYGSMKIFLNEVLKKIPGIGDLLCSYFFKTAIFWEISKGENEWSPWRFIITFQNVFRRVIKWVSIGYCPNYFIPEDNMFYGKIYGRKQKELMSRLRTFHEEGYLCLLRCISIIEPLSLMIKDPTVTNFVSLNEEDFVLKASIEKERLHIIIFNVVDVAHEYDINLMNKDDFVLKSEIDKQRLNILIVLPVSDLSHGYDRTVMMRTLSNTAALEPTSDNMTSAIKLRIRYMLQRLVVVILTIHRRSDLSYRSNRSGYRFLKKAESTLRRTKTFLCLNMIDHAVCAYKNGNYNDTIQTVHYVQRRLQREPYMYWWNLDGDMILGWKQQGLSYEAIVNKFIVTYYIYEPMLSIEELILESYAILQITASYLLSIPPLVFLNFLLILSYTRLRRLDQRNAALTALHSMLYSDDGHHIFFLFKAISWEILGICQQICGDYHGAYQSYVNALNDKYNDFKEATVIRINSLGIEK